jgi:hypothetical protein
MPMATTISFFSGWPMSSFLRALKATTCSVGFLEFRICDTHGCRAIVKMERLRSKADIVASHVEYKYGENGVDGDAGARSSPISYRYGQQRHSIEDKHALSC